MTAARVICFPDDGEPIEFSADLTVRIVPDAPSEVEARCVLMDPPALSAAEDGATADGGELTFVRDENVEFVLPPRTRRFLVARWPGGLTKVQEVPMNEAEE